ncbi:MAG: hypothetical protein KatS3mg117_0697 [Geminicoccaceae bacterium]|nr:MAG: hypothetical protein KatS3mg117_0697 [Geminicoccaceae bacterium]
MIRFALACSAGHEFEGWFKSNEAFDEQRASGGLCCPICGGTSVDKAIMAPAVARSGAADRPPPEVIARFLAIARAVREHVERNFENVGPRFPEEARKIHLGEAEPRDIYGEATPQEVRELLDEGIEVRPLPWVPKLDG